MPENEMQPAPYQDVQTHEPDLWAKNECNLVFVENLPDFLPRIKANTFINMSLSYDSIANINKKTHTPSGM